MATDMGMTDAPIRGSGRKDRNRPERGSGRNHVSQSSSGSGSGLSSVSPELLMTNKFATLPRLVPHHGSQASGGQATPTDQESASAHGSLENLRLSDSESNMAFRRDNPGRISITKKSKSSTSFECSNRLSFLLPLPLPLMWSIVCIKVTHA